MGLFGKKRHQDDDDDWLMDLHGDVNSDELDALGRPAPAPPVVATDDADPGWSDPGWGNAGWGNEVEAAPGEADPDAVEAWSPAVDVTSVQDGFEGWYLPDLEPPLAAPPTPPASPTLDAPDLFEPPLAAPPTPPAPPTLDASNLFDISVFGVARPAPEPDVFGDRHPVGREEALALIESAQVDNTWDPSSFVARTATDNTATDNTATDNTPTDNTATDDGDAPEGDRGSAHHGPAGPEASRYLEILGLTEAASWDDVKVAHAGLLADYGIDRQQDPDHADLAEEIRREMNTAYAALRVLAVN